MPSLLCSHIGRQPSHLLPGQQLVPSLAVWAPPSSARRRQHSFSAAVAVVAEAKALSAPGAPSKHGLQIDKQLSSSHSTASTPKAANASNKGSAEGASRQCSCDSSTSDSRGSRSGATRMSSKGCSSKRLTARSNSLARKKAKQGGNKDTSEWQQQMHLANAIESAEDSRSIADKQKAASDLYQAAGCRSGSSTSDKTSSRGSQRGRKDSSGSSSDGRNRPKARRDSITSAGKGVSTTISSASVNSNSSSGMSNSAISIRSRMGSTSKDIAGGASSGSGITRNDGSGCSSSTGDGRSSSSDSDIATNSSNAARGSRGRRDNSGGDSSGTKLQPRLKRLRVQPNNWRSSNISSPTSNQHATYPGKHMPGGSAGRKQLGSARSSTNSTAAGSNQQRASRAVFNGVKDKSFSELQLLVQQYGKTACLADLVAMFSRLKAVPRQRGQSKAALLDHLWGLLQLQLDQCSPRHCAEVMLTASKLECSIPGLHKRCLEAFTQNTAHADARILSNAIYAVATCHSATVRQECMPLLEDTLLPAFHTAASEAQPQSVSNTMYAAAVMGLSLDMHKLLTQLPEDFWQASKTQEIGNTLWAIAATGQQIPAKIMQQLLDAFMPNLAEAKAQHISNSIYAFAVAQHQIPSEQLGQLLTQLAHITPSNAQSISNALWGVAKMGVQLTQRQVELLLQRLVKCIDEGNAQAVSMPLWAVATMGCTVPPHLLQQLLDALVSMLPTAGAQSTSNTLWAVVTMRLDISMHHLNMLVNDYVAKLPAAGGQSVSNLFWAVSSMEHPYMPQQLLRPAALQIIVSNQLQDMKPMELSNMALACGLLGLQEAALVEPVYERIQQVFTSSVADPAAPVFDLQGLTNTCWAATVLNLQHRVDQLCSMVRIAAAKWDRTTIKDRVQLYQLHIWLVDQQDGTGQALLGDLSHQQLEDCRTAWFELLATITQASGMQASVFSAAKQVPGLKDLALETRTADGLFSLDIAATTESGQQLAIEVDGPWHYRQPDRQPTGSTLWRNRALAVRGYTVVAVPWWEWMSLDKAAMQQKVDYLQNKIKQGLPSRQLQQRQRDALESK